MFIHYSKIIGLNIAELRTQSKVGSVSDVVIDNQFFKILGLVINRNYLWPKNVTVVTISDIIEIEKRGVLINQADSIIPIQDAVRINKQVKNGSVGINQKVISKSGQYLGKVFDYVVDGASFSITKIYIKNILKERIIPTQNILSYKRGVIVIDDDLSTMPLSTATESSSVASSSS